MSDSVILHRQNALSAVDGFEERRKQYAQLVQYLDPDGTSSLDHKTQGRTVHAAEEPGVVVKGAVKTLSSDK